MGGSIWIELVTLGALVWLGYMGARLVARFNLPSVTGFLIVGVVLGPYGAGLLSAELLHKIDFVNPLALGLIVFLIGEELTARMLARHHWSFWVIAVLGTLLPGALVVLGVTWLRPDQPEIAWLLGAIAMSGAPATLMSVLAETRAKGSACDMLLGVSAFSDVATVVGFGAIASVFMVQRGFVSSAGAAMLDTSVEILGGIGLGIAFGAVLGWLLRRAGDEGELLALGLTHVLLVVAAAHLLNVSMLLAPLAMGITVAVVEERAGAEGRTFRALRTVEYPVYIIFFALAGAELDLRVILQGGGLMLVYIVARTAGKYLSGLGGSLLGGLDLRSASWFGLGSLPQAGVAVGLALSASAMFPEIGPTVTAVVLASIIFFEAVGPVAAKNAMLHLGGAPELDATVADGPACRERTVLVPVSHRWSPEKLLQIIRAVQAETGCPPRFVLAHVVTPSRGYTESEALARGQKVLDDLAAVAGAQGYRTETRITASRQADAAIAGMAADVDAELVVLGRPAPTRRALGAIMRSPLHKIVDRLGVPVFVVPEGWEPPALEPGPQEGLVDLEEVESSGERDERHAEEDPGR